jgi:hypothetical protein
MAPIRTVKKNQTSAIEAKQGRLSAFGFTRSSTKEGSEETSTSAGEAVLSKSSSPQAAALPAISASSHGGTQAASVQPLVPAAEAATNRLAPRSEVPGPAPLKKQLPKPVQVGVKNAEFHDDRYGSWEGKYHSQIGTSTRKITFKYHFVMSEYVIPPDVTPWLTDTFDSKHIDDILAFGPCITAKFTDFIFSSEDRDYDEHSGMTGVTDHGLLRLAKACPNLKKVMLQDTSGITEIGHLAFLEWCPKLTSLESVGSQFSSDSFDTLGRHAEWAPKLKKLRVRNGTNSTCMITDTRLDIII